MRIAALVLFVFLIASCANESMDTAMDAAELRSTLDTLWTQYADAADRRDGVAFGHLFHEDAVLAMSGAPNQVGRPAIEAFLVSRYAAIDITAFRVVPEDLKVSGPFAAQSGGFEQDYSQGGAQRTEVGRFVALVERGKDGAWRIRRLLAMADSVGSRVRSDTMSVTPP